MDHPPDTVPNRLGERPADDPSALPARFERAILRRPRPKTPQARKKLRPITNETRRLRLQTVEALVRLGMAVEQMADYLPTIGQGLSRSTLYGYLPQIKVPRTYRPSEGRQSDHDYYTLRTFIRIAKDAATRGFKTYRLAKGTVPFPGARFRPDFKWETGRYLFYLEAQLTDLTEERYEVKVRNYVRMRKLVGRPFKALFVLDQKGEFNAARRAVQQALKGEPAYLRDLFVFLALDQLEGPENLAFDPVWRTAAGERTALLAYLRPVA